MKQTFFRTIVDSKEWKSWEKEVARRFNYHIKKKSKVFKGCWDMDECLELGEISPAHWKDFIKYICKK